MMERALMTPDELKSIPKGHFIVMKTGTHPMRSRLRLYLDWGITFGKPYVLAEKSARPVTYASQRDLMHAIQKSKAKQNPEPEIEMIEKSEKRSTFNTPGFGGEE